MSDHSDSNDSHELNNLDDSLDDYIAEQDIVDSFARMFANKFKARLAALRAGLSCRRSGTRRYIRRNREEAHNLLVADYFAEIPTYSDAMFRRRFRMRRPVFLRIVSALSEWSPFFTQRVDCTSRKGLSLLQKCTAAIRMMAYGTPADELDDYLKIGESTALKCLKHFAKGVIANFAGRYLRRPTCEDVERLLQVGESRGFPDMLGSLDCMHWQWENCPVAWKGQFTRGDHGVPTLMLEAVASYDLWIWHAFFGVAGSNNDINVLNQSPLFIEELKGEAPRVQYTVNERRYNTGYYLVDDIYLEWAAFVKTIPLPQIEKDKRFAQLQEGARKDIERAFGVLQSRFSIVRRPARLWSRASIGNIIKACIILHNMIVEDEREMVTTPLDLNETPGSSVVLPLEMKVGGNTCFADVLQRNAGIRDRSTHTQLKRDLVEHIWKRYG
uniref:Nuclease HARBI1 n=2 Tax=Triticum urartu TaxID=4572 RepID=A0A8R7PN84_TRIUA